MILNIGALLCSEFRLVQLWFNYVVFSSLFQSSRAGTPRMFSQLSCLFVWRASRPFHEEIASSSSNWRQETGQEAEKQTFLSSLFFFLPSCLVAKIGSTYTQTLRQISCVTATSVTSLVFPTWFLFLFLSPLTLRNKVLHSLRLSHDTSHHIPASVRPAPRLGPRRSLFPDSQSRQRLQPFHFPTQPRRKNHNYSSSLKRRLVYRLTVSL